MIAYNVYLNGHIIDTVYFIEGFTESEIRHSLVCHDGYNPQILVFKR